MLHDFLTKFPKNEMSGIETSDFAIKNSIQSAKLITKKVHNYYELKFKDKSFDFYNGDWCYLCSFNY